MLQYCHLQPPSKPFHKAGWTNSDAVSGADSNSLKCQPDDDTQWMCRPVSMYVYTQQGVSVDRNTQLQQIRDATIYYVAPQFC
jgi:hypothetical protein